MSALSLKRVRAASGLKVGISLFLRDGNQSIWENGIYQNGYFLWQLLARCPSIESVFFVNGGPGAVSPATPLFPGDAPPIIDLASAMAGLDIIVELSAQLDADWSRQFAERGGRIIAMRVANDYVIDAERMAFGLSPGLLMAGTPYSEVWTLPAFAQSCAAYYETGLRAPVRIMPHLWNASLLEQTQRDFGYRPGRARWRVAVLEPNICSVKTCHLPMLAADVAHRLNPQAIETLRVFNALAFKVHDGFVAFARSLDLVRQGLATFEGRLPIGEIMGPVCDAILSHHWQNAQNYLYYEALHGGFPLIHNSAALGGCGYRYRDFDPGDGARALLEALVGHDKALDAYRSEARAFLTRLDPCHPDNVALYASAIDAIAHREIAA